MSSRLAVRRDHRVLVAAWAAAWACLGLASCFRAPDPSKLTCATQAGCPSGYVCTSLGHCAPGPSRLDGPAAGAGGSHDGPAAGGADGTLSSGGAGGTSSPEGGSASGGAGGIAAPDAPNGGGGAGGGTPPPDVPRATGGAPSLPDGSVPPDAADAPAGLANGASCTTDGQCTSARCIDGVCCATACTGCNACSSALTGMPDGTCAFAASGKDPRAACADETASNPCGNDGTCDGKGACRKVGAGQKCGPAACSSNGQFTPEPKCDGNGACVPAGSSQMCAPYPCTTTGCAKTCGKQTDCDPGAYCDLAAGTCATQKTNGTPAAQTYECASGVVADGVCCDLACTGQCQSCKQTPGTCTTTTTARSANPCTAGTGCAAMKCDGSHPSCIFVGPEIACASSCSADQRSQLTSSCNGSGACGAVTSTPCGVGTYCSGGACTGQLANGTGPCSGAAACGSGNCSTSPTGGTLCCASSWQNCNQGCFNLDSDPTHCGSCNGDCGPNKICSSKTCFCAGSQFSCGTCSSWNFESNTTEGWDVVPGFTPVTGIAASTFRSVDGTHSLKFHLTNSGAIAVPLCPQGGVTPTTVSSLDFWIYLDGPSTFQPTTGGDLALFYDCSLSQQLDGSAISGTPNQWFEVTRSVSTSQACYFVITVTSGTPWSGDVYIDKVQLTP